MASEASEPRPPLEVVGAGSPEREREAPATGSSSGDRQVSLRTLGGLAALLIAAVLVAVVQTRRASELGGQVETLGAELSAAREEIAAYEGRLGRVRGLVDDLGARLEELRGLLNREPGAADAPEEAL